METPQEMGKHLEAHVRKAKCVDTDGSLARKKNDPTKIKEIKRKRRTFSTLQHRDDGTEPEKPNVTV